MRCVNCKKEIKDDAIFCPHCGAKQTEGGEGNAAVEPGKEAAGQQAAQKTAHTKTTDTKTGTRSPKIAVGIAALVVALGSVVGISYLALRDKAPADGVQVASVEENKSTVENAVENAAEKPTPLYSDVQPGVIDMSVRNIVPGTKAAGMEWDRTLFYWLEDCDTTTDEDGNIAKCRITKTQLVTADSGELVQYEVYRDPVSDEVYKIVSIRSTEDGVDLTDYYYKDGRPNFIFTRHDSVYTPTYATIDKVGERYYMADDVMVRWRMIREPGQIGEYTLNPGEVWYSQADYFAESEEIRGIYDDKEVEMLNRAYNVWNAIAADSGIGTVQGCVRDTAGAPVAGAEVNIYRREDGVLLYQMTTGEDGRFFCYVHSDSTECYLTVAADQAVYKPAMINGLELSEGSLIHSYDNLVLHKLSGDEYPVHMTVCAANEAKTDADGSLSVSTLQGAVVNFREGSGTKEGEILLTAQTGNDGIATANLTSGSYTAEIQMTGYMTTWMNVEVAEQETACTSWVIPTPAEAQTAIVLTWEGEDTDFDLTVFTPYQSTGGDMAHIGGGVGADSRGNLLMADNQSGCEVAYLNTAEAGSFKIYVNDYTDSMAGSYSADRLASLNVHVYIYNADGLAAEYAFPSGQSGVVWEVAEVNRTTVTPSQRVYAEISGKKWWVSGKGKKLLKEERSYFIPRDWETGQAEEAQYTDFRTYVYDDRGNLIEETSGAVGGGSVKRVYTYDEHGKLLTEAEYSDGGDSINEYVYDEQGNCVSRLIYYGTADIDQLDMLPPADTIHYTYDEQNRCIKEISFHDSEGWDRDETEYTYHENGSMAEKITTHFYGEDVSYREVEAYDEHGNCIEYYDQSWDEDLGEWGAGMGGGHENEYNEQGLLIKSRLYNMNTSSGSYSLYFYDESGNLLRREDYYPPEEEWGGGALSGWTEYEYYNSIAEAAAGAGTSDVTPQVSGADNSAADWQTAYRDLLTGADRAEYEQQDLEYHWINLDGDDIPELFHSDGVLIYYSNGTADTFYFAEGYDSSLIVTRYIPGDGCILVDGSLGDDHSVVAGRLENGTFTVTGQGGYNLFSSSGAYYSWEGKNVEPAEFDNYMSTALGDISDFYAKAQLITDTGGRNYDEVLGDLDAGGPF